MTRRRALGHDPPVLLAGALHHVLSSPPALTVIDGIDAWWSGHRRAAEVLADGGGASASTSRPFARAVLGGFAADRLAYAFASGYHEALCQLTGADPTRRRSLCATEAGGAHPRAIEATLDPTPGGGWRLTGHKRWTTLGRHADELLVVARVPSDGPRPTLALVRVPTTRAGVRFEDMPPTAFVPELPHVRVQLEQVAVAADERLPGDGYASYLKPFRTVEDCFVHAAALAWWIRVARVFSWPERVVERCVSVLVTLSGVAAADPGSPVAHVALAGALAQLDDLLEVLTPHWDRADETTRARWERDRPLLSIAQNVRERRRVAAWRRLADA